MTMKVLFERGDGRILGAQIIGTDGADKRIDVIATAMRAEMTAADLTEIDLAYAPPYSSAKDPVNMAGYMIENILEGRVEQLTWSRPLPPRRTRCCWTPAPPERSPADPSTAHFMFPSMSCAST